MGKEIIKHLLKPKEFRVWCLPSKVPSAAMVFTALPSKANCSNCLTKFRASRGGKSSRFKVKHTDRKTRESENLQHCGVCGGPIYRADNYCNQCGSSDFDGMT